MSLPLAILVVLLMNLPVGLLGGLLLFNGRYLWRTDRATLIGGVTLWSVYTAVVQVVGYRLVLAGLTAA